MPRIPLPPRIKLWAPPLIVIPLMLAWSIWGGDSARYILFAHHLFWFVSIIVLIHPVFELIAPRAKHKGKHAAKSPRAKQGSTHLRPKESASSLVERLANLKKQKDAVDTELAQLQGKRK